MKLRRWLYALLLTVIATTPALPWGYEGHEMVGAIADKMLSNNAKQQVQQILGFTLQVAAPWPDCVRSVVQLHDGTFHYLPPPSHPEYRIPCKSFEADASPDEQARMEDYVSRNWTNCTYIPGKVGLCHEAYHFADVAIQRDSYDRRDVGTSNHDVVSAINACIAVLQGKPAPTPFSIKDKKEALFLLAHFVGDIHQPLHVGAVYLDANGQPVDPDANGLDPNTETHGANSIHDGSDNLHSEWDAIPKAWGLAPDDQMLADARAVPATAGPLTGWAASWASDTVMQSHGAFAGLKFSGAGHDKWTVQFLDKTAYDQNAEKMKHTQLAKGGARLAQLLNAIWP
jgi:hypothetical protein